MGRDRNLSHQCGHTRGWCLIYKVPVRPVPNPQLFVPSGIKNSLGTLEWYLNIKTCTSLSKFCTKYCGKQLHFIALLAFAGGFLAWTESPPCGSDNFLPMSKAHLANKLDLYSWRQWSFCLWKTWEGADRWGNSICIGGWRNRSQSKYLVFLVHLAPCLHALQAWTLPWPGHETYPNGVSEHAVQASAFGPDVLEANMVPIIWGLASKNLDQLTSYAPMSLAQTSTRNPWTPGKHPSVHMAYKLQRSVHQSFYTSICNFCGNLRMSEPSLPL